jgi:hypothetical protein
VISCQPPVLSSSTTAAEHVPGSTSRFVRSLLSFSGRRAFLFSCFYFFLSRTDRLKNGTVRQSSPHSSSCTVNSPSTSLSAVSRSSAFPLPASYTVPPCPSLPLLSATATATCNLQVQRVLMRTSPTDMSCSTNKSSRFRKLHFSRLLIIEGCSTRTSSVIDCRWSEAGNVTAVYRRKRKAKRH